MSSASDFDRAIMDFMNDDPLTAYYTQYIQGSYDPSTSTYSTTTIEVACKSIMLDLTRNNNGLSSKFGTEILDGDKELYLLPPPKDDPLALPIQIDTTSDRVRIGNITYKVAVAKVLDPTNADIMLYNLMLRR